MDGAWPWVPDRAARAPTTGSTRRWAGCSRSRSACRSAAARRSCARSGRSRSATSWRSSRSRALVLGARAASPTPPALHLGAGPGADRASASSASSSRARTRAGRRCASTARELTWWSFLMSSAHGAGLMVAPVLIGAGAAEAPARATTRWRRSRSGAMSVPESGAGDRAARRRDDRRDGRRRRRRLRVRRRRGPAQGVGQPRRRVGGGVRRGRACSRCSREAGLLEVEVALDQPLDVGPQLALVAQRRAARRARRRSARGAGRCSGGGSRGRRARAVLLAAAEHGLAGAEARAVELAHAPQLLLARRALVLELVEPVERRLGGLQPRDRLLGRPRPLALQPQRAQQRRAASAPGRRASRGSRRR